MGKYRERFNAKARSGMVAKQQTLKRARNKHLYQSEDGGDDSQATVQPDHPDGSNAEVLIPVSKEEKEARKRTLTQELKRDAPGMSSKKRKRLDKYIDRQLRKEENADLIARITQHQVDTSKLQSLGTLGQNQQQTRKERIAEALELERQGKGTEETRDILYEERETKDWKESDIFKDYTDTTADDSMQTTEVNGSTFEDLRPSKPAVNQFKFGFSNLKKMPAIPKPKYNWRAKVVEEEAKKHMKSKDKAIYYASLQEYGQEDSGSELDSDDDDDESSSGEEESDSEDSESESEAENGTEHQTGDEEEEGDSDDGTGEEDSDANKSDDNDEEEEEWTGFDDNPVVNKVADEDNGSASAGDSDDLQSESSDESSEEAENEVSSQQAGEKRGEAFKSWISSLNPKEKSDISLPEFKGEYIPLERPEDREEPTAEMMIPSQGNRKSVNYVTVTRSEDISTARMNLPVVGEEHRIMEAIHHNDVVVICGETGSGKTTQVPQFLFEAGYGSSGDTPGMIGVTQPRRVAAVSMANRIASELGDHGDKVGYQIRFDSSVKSGTAIKFMTDGVLLRELSADLTLSKYSAIIIDEAHERNVNTDILIGVLSRVMKLRKEMDESKPFKLIIMSATLRVSDFAENQRLFQLPPPVLKVQARQFPVSVHFNRRTAAEYLDQAYDKAVKIHQRLPPGGILIFLTGQNEITGMVKRLRKAFPEKNLNDETLANVRVSSKETTTEVEDIEFGAADELLGLDDFDALEEDEEEEGFDEELEEGQDPQGPMHVLPLYSLLPTREQMRVFEEPPEGSRLVVVATNVAETSLTIPGIRYVVDCGRSKERHYDEATGVQSFKVGWTSKASADQRAGRAGRTGPGHCYRIYSSAVYENDFEQFAKPEIERMPIEGVVLQMKSMGIHNIVNFPFPSPPPRNALKKGLSLLKYLGALDKDDSITDLGKNMSLFPLSPRYAKMLLLGNQADCLGYIVAIVAGLTVGDPFIQQHELGIEKRDEAEEDEEETVETKENRKQLRSKFFKAMGRFSALDDTSDVLKLLCAICAFDYDPSSEFAADNFLRLKQMDEIAKLRKQVAYIVAVNTRENAVEKTIGKVSSKMKPPSKVQIKALKQMVAAGFIDQVAVRADLIATVDKARRPIEFPYASLFPSVDSTDDEEDRYVYIHPSSLLAESGEKPPEYLIFGAMSRGDVTKKIRIRPLCDVTGAQLSNVAKNSALLTYSKPLVEQPYGPKMINANKRECWVVPRMGAAIGSGGVGWDLRPIKVIQARKGTDWIVQ